MPQPKSEFIDRPGQKKPVTGVAELDASRPLPNRGELIHWPLGKVLANYFYVADKAWGVEPGPMPVKINSELLTRLIENEIIEFKSDAEKESIKDLIKKQSDLEQKIKNIKEEKSKKEKSGDTSSALDEQLDKLIEQERASSGKLAAFLQEKMDELHTIVDLRVLAEDKSEKEILVPGSLPRNQLISPEEAEKKGINAEEYAKRQKKLDKLGEVIKAIKKEESALVLIKQDYPNGAPVPPKFRLKKTNAVESGLYSVDTYHAVKVMAALKEGQEGETKNAIFENLGNDIAGLMMKVQRQHLVVKKGANKNDNLSFLTACEYETKLDIMTGCLAGSKGNDKYYVKVERYPEGHVDAEGKSDAGKPVQGRNLQILSERPKNEELEANQYFLVKKGEKWQLFRSELIGNIFKKTLQLREIPLDTPDLLALKKNLDGLSVEAASSKQKDIHDALDQGLKTLDERINGLAEPEKAKAREKFGTRFYRGPIPIRENGFHLSDDTLKNLGEHAALMFFIGDNDTLGSQGQNKGRVGDTFFGLDFGHAFRDKVNPLARDLRTDLSFNGNKSFKNMATFFHDTELSDRMKGMFYLYKAMGEEKRAEIFGAINSTERIKIKQAIQKYEKQDEAFKLKMDEIEDGGILRVFDEYQLKMDELIEVEKKKESPSQKQIKAYESYKKAIQVKKETAQESLKVMGKIMKGRMQLSPQEVDLLQNLERLCSKTTRVSKSGQCLLKHLQVFDPEKNRVEWEMKKEGEQIILKAKVAPKQKAKLIEMLQKYQKEFEHNIGDLNISGTGELTIKCSIDKLDALCELFKEDNIKQFKAEQAPELDATPTHLKERIKAADAARASPSAAAQPTPEASSTPPRPTDQKKWKPPPPTSPRISTAAREGSATLPSVPSPESQGSRPRHPSWQRPGSQTVAPTPTKTAPPSRRPPPPPSLRFP